MPERCLSRKAGIVRCCLRNDSKLIIGIHRDRMTAFVEIRVNVLQIAE